MKRLLLACAALVAAGAFELQPHRSTAQSQPAWPTYHGDAARDGVASVNGPSGTVVALNSWTIPAGINGSPVVGANGVAYVGAEDGNVYAFDPSQPSAPKWTFTTDSNAKAGGVEGTGTLSSDGSTLYIGDEVGDLYALNTSNGNKIWEIQLSGQIRGAPLLSSDGSTLYVVTQVGTVYGITASSGDVQWHQNVVGAVQGSLAASYDGSTLYAVTSTETMYSLSASNGSAESPYYLDSPGISTPALDQNGYIYVTTTQGTLMSFAPSSNTARWSFTVASHTGASSTPAVTSTAIIYAGGDGNVYSINSQTGAPNWTAHSIGAVRASPVVAGSVVYIGSSTGTGADKVYALDLNTGNVLWTKQTGGDIVASPAIGPDGSLWITNLAGQVMRLQKLPPIPLPGSPSAAATSTPAPTSTPSTPVATTTATPTATATQPPATKVTVKVVKKVRPGQRQTITVKAAPNTLVRFRIEYPNGDHQSHHGTTNSAGKLTYKYVQSASKVTHNHQYATAVVRVGSGSAVTTHRRKYKILLGKIDVSVEPRSGKVGQTVSVYVHTSAHTGVTVLLLSPNGRFGRVNGTTGSNGWAHLHYKISRSLRTKANTKLIVEARLRSGSTSVSTKSTLTIK